MRTRLLHIWRPDDKTDLGKSFSWTSISNLKTSLGAHELLERRMVIATDEQEIIRAGKGGVSLISQ